MKKTIMIVAALTMLMATSCKKENIEKDQIRTPKTLSVQVFSTASQTIKVNNVQVIPPCNVYTGDIVYVNVNPGSSTVYGGSGSYNFNRVKVIVDGIIKDEQTCYCVYDKTITID